jgi:hypothetical protein
LKPVLFTKLSRFSLAPDRPGYRSPFSRGACRQLGPEYMPELIDWLVQDTDREGED